MPLPFSLAFWLLCVWGAGWGSLRSILGLGFEYLLKPHKGC